MERSCLLTRIRSSSRYWSSTKTKFMDRSKFEPTDFEYDFERYELFEHRVTFSEAVECFYKDFQIR